MKYNVYFTALLYAIVCALLLTACGREQPRKAYVPPRVNLSNEFMGIVSPPNNGSLRNFTITDDAGRSVLDIPELSKNKIIVLPKGKYEFSADNVAESKVFDLTEDCKIVSTARTFTQNPLVKPPAISFRGSRWDMLGPLTEGASYYLTILDLDNMNEPADSYTATIRGVGNIPLNVNKDNNRIVSRNAHSFSRGTYDVTVSVNGDSSRFASFRFEVRPRPPITLTINNTWGGRPLQYANITVYRVPASVVSPRAVMPRSDDGSGALSFNSFDYANNRHIIRSGGNDRFNIGSNGTIVLPGIYENDRIILVAMGVRAADNVYTNTFTVNSAMYNRRDTTVSWQSIPSKGRNFAVSVPLERRSADALRSANNIDPSFYYRLGNPATIPSQTVLGGNGFNRARVNDFRRETTDRNGVLEYTILYNVDLSDISIVSHFNYLASLDTDVGAFVMNNTSDETSVVPSPIRRQD